MKDPKIKRPSVKGMQNTGYLGHFSQDKYIQKGHNLSWLSPAAGLSSNAAQSHALSVAGKMQAEENQRRAAEQARIQNLARPGSATTVSEPMARLMNRLRSSRARKRVPFPSGGGGVGPGGIF